MKWNDTVIILLAENRMNEPNVLVIFTAFYIGADHV